MNWFQRYGIPGAYFVVLLVTGLYTFLSPEIRKDWEPRAVVGLAAIAFLPIGYVISIGAQWLYLNGMLERLGARRVHRAAMKRLGIPGLGFIGDPRAANEGIVEARTLLLGTLHTNAISLDSHKFIRDWIARRVDVIAINSSIILATFLATIALGILFSFKHAPVSWQMLIIFVSTIALVVLAMILSTHFLTNQIIEVIAGVYRRHRDGSSLEVLKTEASEPQTRVKPKARNHPLRANPPQK